MQALAFQQKELAHWRQIIGESIEAWEQNMQLGIAVLQ